MQPVWQGKGKTMKNPAKFTANDSFYFSGRLIEKGSEVKQVETRNFGWTVWTTPDGQFHIANW